LLPIADGLKVAMELVAHSLDGTPPMGDGAFIVAHVNLCIISNVAVLVEYIQISCVAFVEGLVGVGDRIKAHRFP
jgi:hypothetical protein